MAEMSNYLENALINGTLRATTLNPFLVKKLTASFSLTFAFFNYFSESKFLLNVMRFNFKLISLKSK